MRSIQRDKRNALATFHDTFDIRRTMFAEHQRKLLKELDESFQKGGDKHSPNAKSWTDRVKDIFK